MELLLTVAFVFGLLVGCEWWWRRQNPHNEFSRKFVHITAGSFVAFWPFWLSWDQIRFLSAAFVVTVILSRYLNVFKAIHSVQRPTHGELFFALAVGLTAMFTHDKWVYMAAVLQMSLADGLAAIIGVRAGKGNRYKLLGHTKSVVGSLTFFITSILIVCAYVQFSGRDLDVALILGVAASATLIENLGIRGIDNLLVPLLTAFLLSY